MNGLNSTVVAMLEFRAEKDALIAELEQSKAISDEARARAEEANLAKMMAAEASFKAGDTAMQTFGGFSFAREYDIERKWRETRIMQIAPISTNLILSYVAQHVLGLPRSF